MVFDAFMLPYGYLFERREGVMEIGNKTSFMFSLFFLVVNQYFLSEMKVVEGKMNEYCKNFQGKNGKADLLLNTV